MNIAYNISLAITYFSQVPEIMLYQGTTCICIVCVSYNKICVYCVLVYRIYCVYNLCIVYIVRIVCHVYVGTRCGT